MGNLIGLRRPTSAYPTRNPGAPGALIYPLSEQFWVDNTYNGKAASNGSIVAPFKTLQAAYDAGVAKGLDTLNIMAVHTDPAENLVMAAGLPFLSICGFTQPYAVHNNPTSQFGTITTTGTNVERIGILNCEFSGIANGAHAVVLGNTILSSGWAISAPTATVRIGTTVLYSAGSLQASGLYIVDDLSALHLFQLFANTISASFIQQETIAYLGSDANLVQAFITRSRIVYWKNLLTASRTLTLDAAGTAALSKAVVDCYPQGVGKDLAIIDGGGAGTLVTISGSASRGFRAEFVFDGANWAAATTEVIA